MKKLVKESLHEKWHEEFPGDTPADQGYRAAKRDNYSDEIPEEIANLFLEMGQDIQGELDLPSTPITEMYYDEDSEEYIAVLPETERVRMSSLDRLWDMIEVNFGSYYDAITIEYSKEHNGVIIRLDASHF